MLEEQYRRSEKVRLKNKQEERLLQHEIESHRGMRDVHRYRLEIVKREQKEISRELDRIRMGIKRNLNMSPDWSDFAKQKFDGVRKANQSQSQQKSTLTPRRNQCTKLESLSLNLSRRQMSFDDVMGNTKDDQTNIVELKLEEEEEKRHEDDGDNSGSGSCSSSDDADESMPDPDILKAIMNGIVCDWEQNVMQTITSNQSGTNKNMHLGLETSKHRRGNDSSPFSNATESITPRRSLALNSERDPNLKLTPGHQPISSFSKPLGDRRNNQNLSFSKRRRPSSSSTKSQTRTTGKQKRLQFYDTPDRDMDTGLGKPYKLSTSCALHTTSATVAGWGHVKKPRELNQAAGSSYHQTLTHHQNGLPNIQKDETKKVVAGDEKSPKLFNKSNLLTFKRQVDDRQCTMPRAMISSKKIPAGVSSYSAKDNVVVTKNSFSKRSSDAAVLSSRSEGHRTMTIGGQFKNIVTISSSPESIDNLDNVDCPPTEFNFSLSKNRKLKEETLESSTSSSHQAVGQSRPGDLETKMAKRKEGDNDTDEKRLGMFVASLYKNPKLHIFKKDAI